MYVKDLKFYGFIKQSAQDAKMFTQPALTWSNSAMETPGQFAKYVQSKQ